MNTIYDERAMPKDIQIKIALEAIDWWLSHARYDERYTAVGVAIQDFAHRALIGNHVGVSSPSMTELKECLLNEQQNV